MMQLLEGGSKVKDKETEILKEGYETHQRILKVKNENLKEKTLKVKKVRVVNQKEISDIERKLAAMSIDPDISSGPLPEEA